MENRAGTQWGGRHPRGALVGLAILSAGILLLLRRLGVFIPGWIFTWPMALIAMGIVIGARRGFRDVASVILVMAGLFFLARHEGWISFGPEKYIWPSIIIIAGILIIIRPKRHYSNKGSKTAAGRASGAEDMSDDTFDSIAIFWGARRNITSKDFKKAEVTNIFGGTELNFSQAGISGTAVLDVVVMFGGIKIIVPSGWEVQVNVVHIFAGTEDKRQPQLSAGDKKVLIIAGTVMFGGIDIQSN